MDQVSSPLYTSVYGQVTYCCYSVEFKINFGDLQIWLCHERLRQFARKVNHVVSAKEPLHQLPFSYKVDICPPNCDGEYFRFDIDELLDLQTLLNGSLVMLDLYEFLSDNQFGVGGY